MLALTFELPHDYIEFLRASNGGEGFLGQNYVMLWRVEELKPLDDSYEVAQYAPKLLLFGSNGGGEAYAFNMRVSPWAVVKVPFIGMGDAQSAILLACSFAEFLNNMAHDQAAV